MCTSVSLRFKLYFYYKFTLTCKQLLCISIDVETLCFVILYVFIDNPLMLLLKCQKQNKIN